MEIAPWLHKFHLKQHAPSLDASIKVLFYLVVVFVFILARS
jgi:hypothetical protein